MATLTGKLADVTSKTPENISSITVKAPSARIGSGTDVIVSSPAEVTFNKTTGDITISGLTGGLSWLYIEGDGWSDSIALAVAEGMITLVEAIANAAGTPGLADFIALLVELQNRIDNIAQGAVDEAVDGIKFFRGSLGAGSVDNYFGETWAGSHGIDNAVTTVANITGLPFTNAFGQLLVLVSDQGHTTQIVTCNSGSQAGSMWLRGQSALNQPVWRPWRKLLDERSNPYRGDIPANTDWNDMWGTDWRGKWSADNGTGNGNMGTWSNMPEFRQGELEVSVSDVGFTTHTFKTVNGSVWTRGQGTIARGDRWTPWVNIVDPEVDESHFEHDLRVDRARHRAAPVTVPKRAVAVVLDHGTNAFNSTFLKMFTDRNIPVTIALNGDMYNPDDVRYQYNNLTSWADVKRWHDDHGVEIANHGMTHGNVTDPETQAWEVTESLKVLEDNLPGVPIDSWVGPAGLTLVNDELGFMEHAGTRAMYAKHAVVVSAVIPQYWPLTGEPRVGMSRYWIDTPTGANSSTRNSLLNVPSGHGTMVSFHPETVGQSGKSTVADIEGFLDWLVSQRDAGEFTLLTLREAAFAEYTPRVPLTGTGSPEGKISASVGSTYIDSAATNGAIRWIKASGTGNTGWSVEYGDTGLRDISNLLLNATGAVSIRRTGSTVYLNVKGVTPESTLNSGASFLDVLPVGFRPLERRDFATMSTIRDGVSRSMFQFTTGAMGVWVPSTDDKYFFQHSWPTARAWPTTLPGTPL